MEIWWCQKMIRLASDPKQILVLNYEYPPVGGGAGQVSHNLCRFFADVIKSVEIYFFSRV